MKDGTKYPKLIEKLVKDGNFSMLYLSEKLYVEFHRLSMFRDQLNEYRIRSLNRLHRKMKIYFLEYKEALDKVDGTFSPELLKQSSFFDDLIALGEEEIRQIRHDAKLRGRGYSRAGVILEYTTASVGLLGGADTARTAVKLFVGKIQELDVELAAVETQLSRKCLEIPHTRNILEISGIGENTLSRTLAQMGDISRFDDVKEL